MAKNLIDNVYEKLNSNRIMDGMEDLINGLREIRLNSSEKEWTSIVQSTLLSHPLKEILHADPFTYRSFSKPRGYPGDAVLLDMIYLHQSVNFENVSELGKKIYEYTSQAPACKAVRHRRKYLAQLIDKIAQEKNKPKILSVACGHLREAELSGAVKSGALGSYFAIDQDTESMNIVKRDYEKYGVTSFNSSIRDIIKGNFDKDFDFIYAAGLYDYLDKKVAKKLTCCLFEMLSGGGMLLFANFLPAIKDIGYMESYMGWHLIFRDEIEMVELVQDIPRSKIERIEIVSEKHENLIFVHVYKGK